MPERRFSWRDPQFTYADALSGARLVMPRFGKLA